MKDVLKYGLGETPRILIRIGIIFQASVDGRKLVDVEEYINLILNT